MALKVQITCRNSFGPVSANGEDWGSTPKRLTAAANCMMGLANWRAVTAETTPIEIAANNIHMAARPIWERPQVRCSVENKSQLASDSCTPSAYGPTEVRTW